MFCFTRKRVNFKKLNFYFFSFVAVILPFVRCIDVEPIQRQAVARTR